MQDLGTAGAARRELNASNSLLPLRLRPLGECKLSPLCKAPRLTAAPPAYFTRPADR